MKLLVAAVGQRMPTWVDDAWRDYARRFPPSLPLELKQIRMITRSQNVDVAAARQTEGEALLGAATYPHALVRVMVAEQLYRAWTITQNHPYHRA